MEAGKRGSQWQARFAPYCALWPVELVWYIPIMVRGESAVTSATVHNIVDRCIAALGILLLGTSCILDVLSLGLMSSNVGWIRWAFL